MIYKYEERKTEMLINSSIGYCLDVLNAPGDKQGEFDDFLNNTETCPSAGSIARSVDLQSS